VGQPVTKSAFFLKKRRKRLSEILPLILLKVLKTPENTLEKFRKGRQIPPKVSHFGFWFFHFSQRCTRETRSNLKKKKKVQKCQNLNFA
jgi:hypothetical protein